MKYIIETEDQDEFRRNFNGPKLYSAIYEYQMYLRNKWKYGDVTNEAWFEAAENLTDILLAHGIDMEGDYC